MRIVELSKAEAVASLAEGLAGHAGHFMAVVLLLTREKVLLPLCPSCGALHRGVFTAGLTLIALSLAVIFGFAFTDPATKLKTPLWLDFAVTVGPMLAIALTAIATSLFTWRVRSVSVYRTEENLLYYEFWSRTYQKYLTPAADGDRAGHTLGSDHTPTFTMG